MSCPVKILHVIDGALVAPRAGGRLLRIARFLISPFVAFWRHQDLVVTILQRELNERFKGSVAGWVWAVAAPLLSLVTYTIIFNGAVELQNRAAARSSYDYALFIFGGLIAFNYFSEMAYRAPTLLQEYSHFIKNTIFPAEMIPLISTLRAGVYTGIGLGLMLLAQLVLTRSLHWTVLLLPIWAIALLAFVVGMTWFLSSLGAFTRDVSYLMMTSAPLLMFATPVFFSQLGLRAPWDTLIYLNPMTAYIEIVRNIVVLGDVPSLPICIWTLFISGGSFWGGYWFFCWKRNEIADAI